MMDAMMKSRLLADLRGLLERENKVQCEVCGTVMPEALEHLHDCPIEERTSALMSRLWSQLTGARTPRDRAKGYRVR